MASGNLGTSDSYEVPGSTHCLPASPTHTTSAGHYEKVMDRMTAAEVVKREAAYDIWKCSQGHVEIVLNDRDVPSEVRSLVKEITTLRLPVGQEALTQLLRSQHPHLEDVFVDYAHSSGDKPGSQSNTRLASRLLQTSVAINSIACSMDPNSSAEEWAKMCYLPLLDASKEPGASVSVRPLFDIPSHLYDCSEWPEPESVLRGLLTNQVRVGAAIKSDASFNDPPIPTDHPAQSSLTPLCDAEGLGLFTTTVDWQPPPSDSHSPLTEGTIEPELWYHSRMATGSICRHLHWLGIESPVFGLLFADGRMMLHIDWYDYGRYHDDELQIVSMPIEPLGEIGCEDFRTWDLRDPHAALESALILSYLFQYTATTFADLARKGLNRLKPNAFDREGWKMDPTKMLPVVENAQISKRNTEVVPGPPPAYDTTHCPACGHCLHDTREEGLDMEESATFEPGIGVRP